MITEKEFEYIQKELEESFAYTLHDKLIFISGLLSEDKELEPILNFVNYLLYTEKPELTLTSSIDLSKVPSVSSAFPETEVSFRECNKHICKSCIHYKEEIKGIIKDTYCGKCKYFSQLNSIDNYQKVN